MTKIMLVEDDKSLREIYSIRLAAEGYNIVTAGDGETALAMTIQEKPDLIISDVMMPKISGFDMLDILRSTPETASIRVIMMTALSSEDQRKRGENLGANRYLVKSQVGIEDVVNAVHDVLGDRPTTNGPANINTLSAVQANAAASPAPTPTAAVPPATPTPSVAAPISTPGNQPPISASTIPAPQPPAAQPAPPATTPAPHPQAPPAPTATPQPPIPPVAQPTPAPPQPTQPAPTAPPPTQPTPSQPLPIPLPSPTPPQQSAAQPQPAPTALASERIIQPISAPPTADAPSMADQMAAALGTPTPPNPNPNPHQQ